MRARSLVVVVTLALAAAIPAVAPASRSGGPAPAVDDPDDIITWSEQQQKLREVAEAKAAERQAEQERQERERMQAIEAAARATDSARRDAVTRSDPTLIPDCLRALHAVVHEGRELSPQRLNALLDVFVAFPVEEAGPDLALLVKQLWFEASNDPKRRGNRERAAQALARGASWAVVGALKAAAVDSSLTVRSRCAAAGALVGQDDDAGRVALLSAYRSYLRAMVTRESKDSSSFKVLSAQRDWSLIHTMERLRDETDRGKTQNNIKTVLKAMELHHEPRMSLRKWVADPARKHAGRRYDAAETLGRMGHAEDVAALLDAGPWDDGSSERFRRECEAAVQEICRRLWRERLAEMNRRRETEGPMGLAGVRPPRKVDPQYSDAFLYAGQAPAPPAPPIPPIPSASSASPASQPKSDP